MGGKCKRVTSVFRIIGTNSHKIEEAIALLGLVDEYMNMCNRFASGYQMTHNMGIDLELPVSPSRLRGFDLANQLFRIFAQYFATLEFQSMLHVSERGWAGKHIARRLKYKALTIQRQWLWKKNHHMAGK